MNIVVQLKFRLDCNNQDHQNNNDNAVKFLKGFPSSLPT